VYPLTHLPYTLSLPAVPAYSSDVTREGQYSTYLVSEAAGTGDGAAAGDSDIADANANAIADGNGYTNDAVLQKHYASYVHSETDPTLLFHQRKGAEIVSISCNYRVKDRNNIGNAVLVSYARCGLGAISPDDLPKVPSVLHTSNISSIDSGGGLDIGTDISAGATFASASASSSAEFTAQQLKALISRVLHIPDAGANESSLHVGSLGFLDTPFMHMGLDSLRIMELQSALNVALHSSNGPKFVALDSTVLFDYPTPRRLLGKIDSLVFDRQNKRLGNTSGGSGTAPTAAKSPRNIADDGYEDGNEDDGMYAICGMSCRFPGANNDSPEAFYDLLLKGYDTVGPVPTSWKTSTRRAAFLDGNLAETFDPAFFGLSLEEALNMNPHQRILLEIAHEALVEAKITSETFGKPVQNTAETNSSYNNNNIAHADLQKTGVFVGLCNNEWVRSTADKERRSDAKKEVHTRSQHDAVGPYTGISISQASVANSISFLLGFTGPSMVIDTACSSSLVALHSACQALANGDCAQALVASADLLLSPYSLRIREAAGMLASDGIQKTFDASANGYVRGEGAGCILIKPLKNAKWDCHNNEHAPPILGVIRSTAVNQNGKSATFTAPNGQAQRALLTDCYNRAKFPNNSSQSISYFESHGTGTALGDPVEWGAIREVVLQEPLRNSSKTNRGSSVSNGAHTGSTCFEGAEGLPLVIGAVKTNIGHLEGAAGMAGTCCLF